MLTTLAPAKVNLTLHILGRRDDGYHELHSLVAFASIGDRLGFSPGGSRFTLTTSGPGARALSGEADNLVLKAARALAERLHGLDGGHFTLLKRLPVASGLGGGSSDAAAALRLLAQHHSLPLDHPALMDAARATGSDVPVCLAARMRVMRGTGHELDAPLAWQRLPALLVNPGVAVATAPVFAALGFQRGETRPQDLPAVPATCTRAQALDHIRLGHNDMQPAATGLAPEIAAALALLGQQAGCTLARMSGSGATVFGLFTSCRTAGAAAKALRQVQPGWWVKPAMIG